MSKDRTDFHINLRAARINAGLTKQEAADRLGVHINTLNRWEHDYAPMPSKYLGPLSEIYKTPVRFLISSYEPDGTLKDYTKIVVETDEQDPAAIATITAEEIDAAKGYRIRLTPA